MNITNKSKFFKISMVLTVSFLMLMQLSISPIFAENNVNPTNQPSQDRAAATGDEKGFVGPYTGADGTVYQEVLFLNEANFPDAEFREFLIDHFKSENIVTVRDEIKPFLTKSIIDNKSRFDTQNMKHKDTEYDLTGLEYFKNVDIFILSSASSDGTVVTTGIKVKDVDHLNKCINNMTNLNYISMTFLASVDISGLDLSANKKLETVLIRGGNLPRIDLSKNINLKDVQIRQTGLLEQPKVPNSINKLVLENIENKYNPEILGKPNQIKSVDVSEMNDLSTLYIKYVESLTNVKLGEKPQLKFLDMRNNSISNIDAEGITTAIQQFFLDNNHNLYYVDLSNIKIDEAGPDQDAHFYGNRLLALDLPAKIRDFGIRSISYQNHRGSEITSFALEVDAPKKGEPLKLDSYVPNFKYDRIVKDGSEKSIYMTRYKKGEEKVVIYDYDTGRIPKQLKIDGHRVDGVSVSSEGITGVEPNTFVTYYYDTGAMIRPREGDELHNPYTEKLYLPVLLYVKGYTAKYTFESDTDGKELPDEVKTLCPELDNLANGDEVTPPTPKKSEIRVDGGRWMFDGWKLSGAENQPDPMKVTIEGKNVVFVGHWRYVADNVVNFVNNDNNYATVTVENGKSIDGDSFKDQVMPQQPTKEGYIFKEWNTQKDGKGTVFTGSTVVKEDVTVYAIYEKKVIPNDNITPNTDNNDKPKPALDKNPKKPQKSDVSVNTGDDAYLSLYLAFIVLSVSLCAIICLARKKEN
ncbi:MAG: SHIRT domain-containing protein [Eubacteriales bacterium]|nr:SHIRT domain-containing protein [Eubacteriales bacterium]MDY3333087.1 SHIRT domain-containing protein [Gallibacter sp.]